MTRLASLPALSALLLLLSSPAGQAQSSPGVESKEHISRVCTLTADAGRSTLALYNISGSVTVQGYTGSQVLVEATKTIRAADAKTLETGKSEAQLGFTQHGDSVAVYLAAPFDSRPNHNNRRSDDHRSIAYDYDFDFVVKVPYQLNLHVSTVNRGAVRVQDVTGTLSVTNVNGPIALSNVKGTTQAHTVNGDVDATYAANPPGASSYYALNGQIRVHYPATLSADMHFKSMHGEFYTDFADAQLLPAHATKNEAGRGTVYQLTKERAVRIGSGGPALHFETLNGDVTVSQH